MRHQQALSLFIYTALSLYAQLTALSPFIRMLFLSLYTKLFLSFKAKQELLQQYISELTRNIEQAETILRIARNKRWTTTDEEYLHAFDTRHRHEWKLKHQALSSTRIQPTMDSKDLHRSGKKGIY